MSATPHKPDAQNEDLEPASQRQVQQPGAQNQEQQAGGQSQNQREALEEAEKNASRNQPGSYKEEATKDKIVEIGPDLEDDPIKGIDPPEAPKAGA